VVLEQQQVLLTTTDLSPLSSDFVARADVHRVVAGTVARHDRRAET
jgi:hypothetical protein